jgi:hypothetical protein
MIRIQEIATAGQFITLLRPVGKEIPLRVGEILEGQVVDVFPSGGLTIKVKGWFLPARTDLEFQKDQNVFLKVAGQKGQNGELILQVIGQKSSASNKTEGTPAHRDNPLQGFEDLFGQVSDLIGRLAGSGRDGRGTGENNSRLLAVETGKLINLLEGLLKVLSGRIELIPKALRAELQQILQYSLTSQGQDIQNRISRLIGQIAEDMSAPLLVETLKERLLLSMDGLISSQLKAALENSGVVLEARIKAFIEGSHSMEQSGHGDGQKINKDLKAILLQLKEALGQEEGGAQDGFLQKAAGFGKHDKGEILQGQQRVAFEVNSLLKDLEIFQFLSKVSDSFWTFLPVQWKELRNGDLVFKRRTAPNGDASYSCGIHLDLGEMGLVSVFIVSQFKDFIITFNIDHPGLSALVDSHLTELKENFEAAGLFARNISLLNRSEKIPDPFEYTGPGETLISIRI